MVTINSISSADRGFLDHQEKIVGICGPSGSGKSTFCRILAALGGFACINEPINKPLLDDFSRDPRRYAYSLMEYVIMSREKSYRLISQANARVILFDRTIEEDREILVRLFNSMGYLDPEGAARLTDLSYRAQARIPKIDLLIGLTANLETIRGRITRDKGRPGVVVDSISQQYEFYEEWYRKKELSLLIDTSEIAQEKMTEIGKQIVACLNE